MSLFFGRLYTFQIFFALGRNYTGQGFCLWPLKTQFMWIRPIHIGPVPYVSIFDFLNCPNFVIPHDISLYICFNFTVPHCLWTLINKIQTLPYY